MQGLTLAKQVLYHLIDMIFLKKIEEMRELVLPDIKTV
jgi:hypothetical protein